MKQKTMSLNFFKNKREENLRKILDIILYLDGGCGNVRGAILEKDEKGNYGILASFYGNHKIGDKEEIRSAVSLSASVSSVLSKIQENLINMPKTYSYSNSLGEVHCFLAPQHHFSQTKVIRYIQDRPFVLTNGLVSKIIEKGDRNSVYFDYNDNPKNFISKKIIDIKLNGYNIVEPYGAEGRELEVSLFRTNVKEDVVNSITSAIRKYFQIPITVEPFSLASFISLRNYFPDIENFILITIGNETSSVSVIKDHILLDSASIPFGKYTFFKNLSLDIRITPEDTQLLTKLYRERRLNQEQKAKLESSMSVKKEVWLDQLRKILIGLCEGITMPANVFLVADVEIKDIFSDFIRNDSFLNKSIMPHGTVVNTVEDFHLARVCPTLRNVEPDVFLSVGASFVASPKIRLF